MTDAITTLSNLLFKDGETDAYSNEGGHLASEQLGRDSTLPPCVYFSVASTGCASQGYGLGLHLYTSPNGQHRAPHTVRA